MLMYKKSCSNSLSSGVHTLYSLSWDSQFHTQWTKGQQLLGLDMHG